MPKYFSIILKHFAIILSYAQVRQKSYQYYAQIYAGIMSQGLVSNPLLGGFIIAWVWLFADVM